MKRLLIFLIGSIIGLLWISPTWAVKPALVFGWQAKPLVTGQTISYASGTTDIDDGALESGVTRDYTVLTTGQYAGTTNITINGKTIAMENACTRDNQSGLMWMSRTPDSDIGPGNDGKLYWSIDVDENIWQFLVEANANSLGGHNDWRVPSINELHQLANYGINSPCIDTTAFPSTPNEHFWTSTTRSDDATMAFTQGFTYGIAYRYDKVITPLYIRLVRDAD